MMIDPGHLKTATSIGVAPIIHWRTPNGIYKNASSADKTVVLSLEAEGALSPTTHGGITRVEIAVSVNGSLVKTYKLSGRTWGTPNYYPATGRMPYAQNGKPSPFFAFHQVLDLVPLASGTITIVPTAITASGETAVGETLTIYSDLDGTDRRPSNKVVYVASTGSDSTGNGTQGNPYKTLQVAINNAVKNPGGGNFLVDRDAGGAEIRALDGVVGFSAGYTASDWYTSGAWRLTIKAVGTDKTMRRANTAAPDQFTVPNDYIGGAGNGSATVNAHLVFEDFVGVGPGFSAPARTGVTYTIQDFNCEIHSSHYVPGSALPHVNYAREEGSLINFEGNGIGRRWTWGLYCHDVSKGPSGHHSLHDCKIDRSTAVSVLVLDNESPNPIHTVIQYSGKAYEPGKVDGFLNFTDGANLSFAVAGTDLLSVLTPDTSNAANIAAHASGIVGNTYWGVKIENPPDGVAAGTYQLLGVGFAGPYPYLLLYVPGATAPGIGGLATTKLVTARLATGVAYTEAVHTDYHQIVSNLTGAMFAHHRGFNNGGTRTWVGDGKTFVRCCWKNLSDGSTYSIDPLTWSFVNATLTDCWFYNMSLGSGAQNWTGAVSTRLNLVDCALGHVSDFPANGTSFVRSNHFITSPAYGALATLGSWFEIEPTQYGGSDQKPLDTWIGNKPSRLQAYPKEAGWA